MIVTIMITADGLRIKQYKYFFAQVVTVNVTTCAKNK